MRQYGIEKELDISSRAIEILNDLVAFDTTSRESNLEIIEYADNMLAPLGATLRRWPNSHGDKANLLASFGPLHREGGIVLSGHTDVVPVDGQAWTTPPFMLSRRGDRLYGRGTSDMKSFIAVALAAAPLFAESAIERPLHLALSYDEEVGCAGAPAMIDAIARLDMPPRIAIVGEPTSMRIIGAHKGISSYAVVVTGKEAHSSLVRHGLSANMAAIGLLSRLERLALELEQRRGAGMFEPGWSTLTIGLISGGTAGNILAKECRFEFDLRTVPEDDPEQILAPFVEAVRSLDLSLRSRFPEAGATITRIASAPPLEMREDGDAEKLVRQILGSNEPMAAVAYGTEAGLFQRGGMETVICGPGSIEQAHAPDEFIDVNQIDLCAAFMARLAERLRHPSPA